MNNSLKKNNTSPVTSSNNSASQNKPPFTQSNSNTKTNNTKTNNTKINNTTKTNNQSSNATTSSVSTSSVFGIIILVVVIIALIGGSYWLYNFYSTRNFQSYVEEVLLSDVTDATVIKNIESSKIPTSSFSNEYSISMWINVQDYNYNYGKEKIIISRGQTGSPGNPEILLGSKLNDLIVRIKLQTGGTPKTVSNFEDIPIRLPSNNTGLGFINPETLDQNENILSLSESSCKSSNSNSLTDSLSNSLFDSSSNDLTDSLPDSLSGSFMKIGSNNIDYPTIQYTFDNNDSINQCGYFDLISGNTINNKTNEIQKNGNKLVEGFTNIDDAINAAVKVIVDICNISTTIQSQQSADDSVENITKFFQSMITALEEVKKNIKTGSDINKESADAIKSLSSNLDIQLFSQNINTTITNQFTTLNDDLQALSQFENVQVDYNAFATALNTKMSSINCPILITGSSDIDNTISLYENIINLMQKTFLIYISKMANSINSKYPEIGGATGNQNASCLVSNYTSTDPSIGTCVVKMLPIQKWVNVIVSVYNQVVDIYVDGQLTSSCILKSFPEISKDALNITPDGGFSGKISRVVFMNTAMTVKKSKDIYYSGPVIVESIFSLIPNWAYWTILVIVIIAIVYSVFA